MLSTKLTEKKAFNEMSKLCNLYQNNVDKVWYKSTNIKYSECIDNTDELKTLKVVFANGSQYQYDDVDVRHYMLFRESESQGKALNMYIKSAGFPYKKLENADLAKIDEEYELLTGDSLLLENEGSFKVKSPRGEVLYEQESEMTNDNLSTLKNILVALGHKVKTI